MSINKAIITGYLGGDPELRFTNSGSAVLSFNVAVNDRVSNGNGGYTERANWIKVTVWGNRSEALAKILKKGHKVAVEGRLKQERWEHNGETRSSVSVTANEIELMSARASGSNDSSYQQAQQTSASSPTSVYDADIPF